MVVLVLMSTRASFNWNPREKVSKVAFNVDSKPIIRAFTIIESDLCILNTIAEDVSAVCTIIARDFIHAFFPDTDSFIV